MSPRSPVQVALRLLEGLPSVRRAKESKVVLAACEAASERDGFRVVRCTFSKGHLHLTVRAKDRVTLARGMQGLSIRIAKGLNRLWGREGAIFADRYERTG